MLVFKDNEEDIVCLLESPNGSRRVIARASRRADAAAAGSLPNSWRMEAGVGGNDLSRIALAGMLAAAYQAQRNFILVEELARKAYLELPDKKEK